MPNGSHLHVKFTTKDEIREKEACTKVQEKLHGTGFEKLYELFTILVEQAHNNNMLSTLAHFYDKKKYRFQKVMI